MFGVGVETPLQRATRKLLLYRARWRVVVADGKAALRGTKITNERLMPPMWKTTSAMFLKECTTSRGITTR
eukprot:COSAG02_NODE_392_length_23227_cov_30.763620_24_plen_71_part_00